MSSVQILFVRLTILTVSDIPIMPNMKHFSRLEV